uniref:Replication factor A C-terminal domain-containing protein n=1 Tax=Melopsittacus undulatus TaxID=13146 RepID=A0A8V5FN14_MELUD
MKSVRGLLAASVISIQNSCFIYPACQNCFSRLILDSRRFNCPKCGCTGEAKDASYRYRLSLKIADTNDLFDITVFGSCLDPFFGLSGETNTDVSQAVLFQAVETCFIGKRFIFGVKGWAREDGGHPAASSILQNCSRINRSTKTLTACQLFLPNAAVTGFTVISYFHRLLQSAKLRSCSNSSDLPDTSAAAADEAVSELSSLSSLSRNSCSVQPSGRESPLRSWQESLSLTSSVAWVTAEDFPTLEVGKLASEQHEQEGSSSDSTSATDELERISSSECSHGTSSRLFQHPLESEVQSAYPKTDGRNYSCPEKSHNSLLSKKDASASSHINVTGVSQMDSMLWDELAFSESLNEFLARIEEEALLSLSSHLQILGRSIPNASDPGLPFRTLCCSSLLAS